MGSKLPFGGSAKNPDEEVGSQSYNRATIIG
jgi:hypothetical protein